MESTFTSGVPQEWIGQKVRVLTSISFGNEIKGILSKTGSDYIVIGKDIVNVSHIVKIRKA